MELSSIFTPSQLIQAIGALDGYIANPANGASPDDVSIVRLIYQGADPGRIAGSPAGKLMLWFDAWVPSVDNPTPLTDPQKAEVVETLLSIWDNALSVFGS